METTWVEAVVLDLDLGPECGEPEGDLGPVTSKPLDEKKMQ
jgi:hypothetical protein